MNIVLHHIGIVTKNIEESIKIFSLIGFNRDGEKLEDTIQNNILQMISDSNGNKIELIEPLNEKSTVNIQSEGLHHLAFQVDDEEAFFKAIKNNKIGKTFTTPIAAPLFNLNEVIFTYLNNNIIIEIVR